MFSNGRIHLRLGKRGLIAFVMALAAIAIHVDDDVLLEVIAEFRRQPCHMHYGFRVIAIHVEHRCLNDFRHLRTIRARTGIGRRGGEANLVVDHDMDCAARLVAFQLRELKVSATRPWPMNAASPWSRMPMTRLRSLSLRWRLLRTDAPDHNWIDDFQMRRVRRQDRWTVLPSNSRSDDVPRWYFTSPEP